MADKYISKVIYNGQTLIDLTGDTVDKDKLLRGETAHGRDGAPITGECDFDADTSDANATASEILSTRTAYVQGTKVTGTMENKGSVQGVMSGWSEDKKTEPQYVIEAGYHDGGGRVHLSKADKDALIASNIRAGYTILGITGTMDGNEDEYLQEKTVEAPLGGPNDSGQDLIVVKDDTDAEGKAYTGLSKVTVKKVPYSEVPNAVGGITVTIGGKTST